MIERDRYSDVFKAALAWWEGRRPHGFTAQDHLREPMVNCCGELERALARAVAVDRRVRGGLWRDDENTCGM